jgi:hypothetical protein
MRVLRVEDEILNVDAFTQLVDRGVIGTFAPA